MTTLETALVLVFIVLRSIVLPGRKAPLAAWQNDGGQNDGRRMSESSRCSISGLDTT